MNEWTKELEKAIKKGDFTAFAYAIEKGADINAIFQDGGNYSILSYLIRLNRSEMYDVLIENGHEMGLDINRENNIGGTPIMTALFIDNKQAVKKILDYYGDELDFDARIDSGMDIMYYTKIYLSDEILRSRIKELYDKFEAKK